MEGTHLLQRCSDLLFFMLIRGSLRDVVYLGWPIAPSYMSPNVGGGGGCVGLRSLSQNEYNCAHHVKWSPNKLWRSNSIFDLVLRLCEGFI
jgi:hypothetical protein